MKFKDGIYAGTLLDFYRFIQYEIFKDCQERKPKFKGYDVGFCHTYTRYDLPALDVKEAYDDVQGWYGVKLLDTGFESYSTRQFCSDYYGGGDFGCCDIYTDDIDEAYVNREVEEMLNKTFRNNFSTEVVCWEESK